MQSAENSPGAVGCEYEKHTYRSQSIEYGEIAAISPDAVRLRLAPHRGSLAEAPISDLIRYEMLTARHHGVG